MLNQVEVDAENMGAKLIHLDTFNHQAKDFYLKHGYEIFGVLENCPTGQKRYFMKKYCRNQMTKTRDVFKTATNSHPIDISWSEPQEWCNFVLFRSTWLPDRLIEIYFWNRFDELLQLFVCNRKDLLR